MRESFNFISLQIYHVRICARSAIDICTNCGCISGRPLRNSSQFFQRLMDEKKEKKGKEPRLFWSIHYSSFTFSELKGNPNFISMIRSRPMLHVDELFYSSLLHEYALFLPIFNFDRSAGTIGNNLVSYLYYVLKLKTFENF